MNAIPMPSLDEILGSASVMDDTRTKSTGPEGMLPLTEEMLLNEPSGNIFGLALNAGMGWNPSEVGKDAYLILTTQGGLRAEDGTPLALGYHTGHWELGLLVREAAQVLRDYQAVPFVAYCSDPCDGRIQGTPGMMDSLAYRNDAAIVMRRLIRTLPTRRGLLGIATCDKGLPATMMALAGSKNLPGIVVPGGVTLPPKDGEDAGKIQTLGARFAHGIIDLEYAMDVGCRACASPGGGCQFLGTAATSQVVCEALGMSLPHSALAPSGEPVWLETARLSARALLRLKALNLALADILTWESLENAMLVHAAFGGSTNLIMHLAAIAYDAGLPRPSRRDWEQANHATPRLVDVLPNGPRNHPTVQVFMAGAVPEVMLHLRRIGLLNQDVLTVTGEKLSTVLDWWETSDRRRAARKYLNEADGVDPERVILDPDTARAEGMTGTLVFPVGNIAPYGSVVKATAIDPGLVDANQVYNHRGRARVFTSENGAIRAIKGLEGEPVKAGDVLVVIGGGPLGTGMEETYELTSALVHLPWGKEVPLLTDARFSGVTTGACVGWISPEALAGGPFGKLRDGDVVEIVIDRKQLSGKLNLVGTAEGDLTPAEADALLSMREPHPDLKSHPLLPSDTRLWATLQEASGGPWGGAIYDVDRIVSLIQAGKQTLGY
jgi:putative YjhG/YagF family dehydratase